MHLWKPLSFAALVVLFLSSCSIGSTAKTTLPPTNSAFAQKKCPSEITTLANARQFTCGFVTVPADQRNPNNGKTIKVAIAIFQKGAKPDPDPVFFLQGGPGGSSIQGFGPAFASGTFSFGNHDVIFVDQRGTGLSQPSLQCSEVVDLQYHFDVNLTLQQQITNQDKAL